MFGTVLELCLGEYGPLRFCQFLIPLRSFLECMGRLTEDGPAPFPLVADDTTHRMSLSLALANFFLIVIARLLYPICVTDVES